MRALVTGGGGFLGGAIVRRLLSAHHRVRGFSRGRYPALAELGVEQYQGDLADRAALGRACADCDIVFHVAARAGLGGRWWDYYRPNVIGTRNVVSACRDQGVARLVYTSSPSVIFTGRDMEGANESVPYPRRYEAHYPRSKALAERHVLAANGTELATVALRPHLIWGPGDNYLVPRILARARAGRLWRLGPDSKLIDSVYVDNAAEAHVLAAERLGPGSAVAGRAYFISNGEPLPLWDLVNRVLAAARLPPVTRTVPARLAWLGGALCDLAWGVFRPDREPPMTRFLAHELATAHWFDTGAARRDLGYEPRVSIDEGMARLARWLGGEPPGDPSGAPRRG
jgi:nucleoside-diphosphate-sugar epimerase